jgi:hypothetical protein
LKKKAGWAKGILLKDLGVELESTGRPGITVARDSLSNSVNMK